MSNRKNANAIMANTNELAQTFVSPWQLELVNEQTVNFDNDHLLDPIFMGRNDELSWNFDYVEALKRQTLPSEPSISDSEGLCVDVFLPQQLDAWEVSICNSGRAVNDEVPDSQSTNGVLEEPAAAFHTGVCEPSKTAFDHFGVDTIPSTLITEPESEIFDWESLVKIDEDTGFNPTEKMPHEEHQGGQSCRIGELDLMRGEGIAIGQSDGDDDVAILAMIEEYFKNPQVADVSQHIKHASGEKASVQQVPRTIRAPCLDGISVVRSLAAHERQKRPERKRQQPERLSDYYAYGLGCPQRDEFILEVLKRCKRLKRQIKRLRTAGNGSALTALRRKCRQTFEAADCKHWEEVKASIMEMKEAAEHMIQAVSSRKTQRLVFRIISSLHDIEEYLALL